MLINYLATPRRIWYLILCYILLIGLSRLFIFPQVLLRNEAEIVYQAQWLKAGYGIQPPLYTWIQYLSDQLFGIQIFPVVIFKLIIIIITYFGIYKIFSFTSADNPHAVSVGMLSLGLVVQLWYETFVISHTLLVTMASVWSVYFMIRISDKPSGTKYIILGLLLGIGFLSKYNFVLVILSILIAGLSIDKIKRAIITPKILLTVITFFLIISPHLIWVFDNMDQLKTNLISKVNVKSSDFTLEITLINLGTLVLRIISFIGIWFFVSLMFFRKAVIDINRSGISMWAIFFRRHILIVILMLIASGILWNITYYERYLQPLLIFIPVYALLELSKRLAFESKAILWYTRVCVLSYILIFFAHFIEPVISPFFNFTNSYHRPYKEISEVLKNEIGDRDIIIVDSEVKAGNFRYHLPEEKIILWDDYFLGEYEKRNPEICCFYYIWSANNKDIPEMIKSDTFYQTSKESSLPVFIDFDYSFSTKKKYRIGMIHVTK